MSAWLELGLDTFGDVTVDGAGRRLSDAQVIRDVVDEAVLADRVGVDTFGIGEHHRADFAVSSPETVLAAIAGRTERIRLGSAVPRAPTAACAPGSGWAAARSRWSGRPATACRAEFEHAAGPDGALYVGAPGTVAAKIARTVAALGLSRFTMKYSAGTLPHGQLMQSIELFGTEVVPQVRALVAGDEPRRERDEVSSGG